MRSPAEGREESGSESGRGGNRGGKGGGGPPPNASSERNGASGNHNRMGSNQPPIVLTVRLKNTGAENLSITVREVESALGNFVASSD